MSTVLELRGVEKAFGAHSVLRGVDLSIEAGEVVAMIGPSGSGKTTLGRVICGLEKACRGVVERRARSMLVAQDFAIWPELSAIRNVELGHPQRGTRVAREAANEWLIRLGLERCAERRAGELSFGQQQRVSLARALCFGPELLVLDEPFANLDPAARADAGNEVGRLCREQNCAALWITHDAREAFAQADRLSVLIDGQIAQIGTPREVYIHPLNASVARLTGPIEIVEVSKVRSHLEGLPDSIRDDQMVGIRPETVEIREFDGGPWRVTQTHFMLGVWECVLESSRNSVALRLYHCSPLPVGTTCRLHLKEEPCVF